MTEKVSAEIVATCIKSVHVGGLGSGEVECGRCLAVYSYGTRHRCFASEPKLKGEDLVEFQFKITFKEGQQVQAVVTGRKDVAKNLTMGECAEGILQAEQFLEKLTGLRVHIEQVG